MNNSLDYTNGYDKRPRGGRNPRPGSNRFPSTDVDGLFHLRLLYCHDTRRRWKWAVNGILSDPLSQRSRCLPNVVLFVAVALNFMYNAYGIVRLRLISGVDQQGL